MELRTLYLAETITRVRACEESRFSAAMLYFGYEVSWIRRQRGPPMGRLNASQGSINTRYWRDGMAVTVHCWLCSQLELPREKRVQQYSFEAIKEVEYSVFVRSIVRSQDGNLR